MAETPNTKVYKPTGGASLNVDSGGSIVFPSGSVTDVAAYQAASTASDVATLKTDFNTLLAALKACGLMKPTA